MSIKHQIQKREKLRNLSMGNTLLTALSALLSFVLAFLVLAVPVDAANLPPKLLTLEDLPAGFTEFSDVETPVCSFFGGVANAFVLENHSQTEAICVSSESISNLIGKNELAVAVDSAMLDKALSNPEFFLQLLGQEKPADLEMIADVNDIGDVATGFSRNVEEVGRVDVAIFRRGSTVNSVVVIYPIDNAPVIPLHDVASKLDTRLIQYSDNNEGRTVASTLTNTSQRRLSKVGEVVEQGSYALVVNEVEMGQSYNSYIQPKPGNQFIAIDLTIISKADQGVSANGLFAVLKDSEGFQYRPRFSGKDPQLGSENDIPNGDKVRGWLTFEVPETAEGLVFEYRPFNVRALRISLS